MHVNLRFEEPTFNDVSIMVDVLRASTTIPVALNNFDQIIAVKDKNKAIELADEHEAVLAGERNGAPIEGFDAGNSPIQIREFHGETLIITTSNGTRILENMGSKALIGSFINAEAVAEAASQIANDHIEIVMAGVKGKFAIEDFLGAGEIISYLTYHDLDEKALASYMASRNEEMVNKAVKNSISGLKLKNLGYNDDVSFCIKRNICNIVPIYKEGIIKKFI